MLFLATERRDINTVKVMQSEERDVHKNINNSDKATQKATELHQNDLTKGRGSNGPAKQFSFNP
jgi:hypothetical protein